MVELTRKLPEAELEVMLAVWDATEPVPRIRLEEALQGHHWNRNTINTYLARLMERGVLTSERCGNTNYYRSTITREEYQQFEGRRLLDKLYGSSVTRFVAMLGESGELTNDDLSELQRYLDELQQEKKK